MDAKTSENTVLAAGLVTEHLADGLCTLTLNQPGSRNALSLAMLEQLQALFTKAATDPAVRVVILAASGKVFCAGHDLKEVTAAREASDGGKALFTKLMASCSQLMQTIIDCPKPVIAQVQGTATAAGCQLVATCDLAVAAENASFATPGVHIGLFCSTPMVALSRNVSPKHAMEMLLTGEAVDAVDALRMGLVNRVVPSEELEDAVRALALKIAAKSQMTLKTGKAAFYRQREMSLSEAYDYCSRVMVENLLREDSKEGIGAFIEKRSPNWTD